MYFLYTTLVFYLRESDQSVRSSLFVNNNTSPLLSVVRLIASNTLLFASALYTNFAVSVLVLYDHMSSENDSLPLYQSSGTIPFIEL